MFGDSLEKGMQSLGRVNDRGYQGVLEAWGRETLFPSIAARWPRTGWPPLAPSTLAEKRRKGYPATPLIRTGRLFQAATQPGAPGNIFNVGPFSVEFGVSASVEYATYLYFGTFRIPARPWDDIPEEALADLDRRLSAEMEGRMTRAT